ncbi:response regulator [Paenibacillus sp. N4]|uniref:response regulator transcription factor n=1 Tax=Paenibacillus vietnamensis TaxID=2590547 RepID=UPI001CD0AC52|nr:response regulator [Paenibacillus vietnamensis]MCA0757293.1 response regulator [Paenibacillus vietnamensis]
MYKVILVDDEPLALEGLQFMVDWEKHGFKIHSVYNNGEEALRSIMEVTPDLVFTDIRMPVRDGLSLIREIRGQGNEWTKFVILSGYDDFDYAIQAMDLGVTLYLTKPIDSVEVGDVLFRLQKEFIKREQQKLLQIHADRFLIEHELSVLLFDNGENKRKTVSNVLSSLSAKASQWVYCLIGTEAENYSMAREVARRITEEKDCCYLVDMERLTFGMVLRLSGEGHTDVQTFAEQLLQTMQMIAPGKIEIAVGSVVDKLELLFQSYNCAKEAEQFLFFGPNRLVYYEEIKDKLLSSDPKVLKITDSILKMMENGAPEELSAVVRKTSHFFEESMILPELVRIFITQVMLRCASVYKELGGKPNMLMDDFAAAAVSSYDRRLHDAFTLLEKYCLKCQMLCSQLQSLHAGSTQEKVAAFLRSHYSDPITIKDIAERFHMNPAYLGQSFLRRYGVGILDYLHNLRIEEAKRLLRETEMTSTSIAESIGYQRYQYFLKQFERRTGMRPGDYRAHSSQ